MRSARPAEIERQLWQTLRPAISFDEASAVYGETDIIAKVEVPGQAELDQLVFHQVQGLPEVEATRTFIVVGGLHWTRGDG